MYYHIIMEFVINTSIYRALSLHIYSASSLTSPANSQILYVEQPNFPNQPAANMQLLITSKCIFGLCNKNEPHLVSRSSSFEPKYKSGEIHSHLYSSTGSILSHCLPAVSGKEISQSLWVDKTEQPTCAAQIQEACSLIMSLWQRDR